MKTAGFILFIISTIIFPRGTLTGQIPIGAWQDHYAYSHANLVTESPGKIYCVTSSGFFYYDQGDNSLHPFSKIQGLSDHDISVAAWAPSEEMLVIAYKNTNIDLVGKDKITNIRDILRKDIAGEKTVYDILILDSEAYLSCSFGIVVINLDKKEIKDTYIIGENGRQIRIYSLAYQPPYLYAATEEGLYRADRNAPDLVYYEAWSRIPDIPSSHKSFSKIVSFQDHLFVNRTDVSYAQDTIYYQKNDGTWVVFSSLPGIKNFNLRVSHNHFLIASDQLIQIFNANLQPVHVINDYGYDKPKARDALYDEKGTLWIANAEGGLVHTTDYQNYPSASPDGPYTAEAYYLRAWNRTLAIACGGRDASWNSTWNVAKIYLFRDNRWNNIIEYDFKDVVRILEDPLDPDVFYASSWNYGILVYKSGKLETIYNDENSTLQSIIPGQDYIRVGGMAFDHDHRLWVTNALVNNPVSVRMEDGTWHSLPYGKYLNNMETGDIVITDNAYKWVLLPRGHGLFVFDDNNTPENASDDRAKRMAVIDQEGASHNNLFAIAKDKNEYIWVGSDQGPLVYYSPFQVFDQPVLPAHRIKVPRNDGSNLADYLLSTELITCITVDGADRKWFGTQKSGAFLISPDGLAQIHHFTSSNSPLPSDNIQSIAIEPTTGEVFFGTDKGVISYRGTATDGSSDHSQAYAFPNPVRENYIGPITITGLLPESTVKITDISGNLVYETISLGGQALWYGKNMSGEKVSSGIYLVFISDKNGMQTQIVKILVIQ
ncbi:MAG: T9SS type A sorting domain-containing protein [Bacteroidales bacterium]|nr:T9SS type A sorting domain-containing protein [Bacteroidales bacterium]